MAHTIQVDGLATIKMGIAAAATASVGYTENGVEITEVNYPYDVNTDENGGDAGPPVDVQEMGEVHIIRLLMTKWDETVMDTIRAINVGMTAGDLHIANGKYFRVLINSVLRPRNYPTCIIREPREINKGTKHSKLMIVATAYKVQGLLYNAVITG